MTCPVPKQIGKLRISVDSCGWPRWTRIEFDGVEMELLNEEEAHDLHYALSRIVEFLDDAKRTDLARGIVQAYG